jgi:hypothetical protein
MYRALVIFAAFLLFAVAAPASAWAICPRPLPYPGDDASKTSLARWMATGAAARQIPPELPVMAALVESGLANLPDADGDSLGFFQMRERYWNQGEYAGYPDNPELQLEWFVDHALLERARRIAKGLGTTEYEYGEWIADVEKPAAQYRGRYQLRLGEARALIGSFCTGIPGDAFADETPPLLTLVGLRTRRVLERRRVSVKVDCGPDDCSLTGRGAVKLYAGVYRISARPVDLQPGEKAVMRFPLGARALRAARRALAGGAPVRARIAVTAVDGSANAVTKRWTARLRG